jgi:hypothetical protein
MFVITDNIIKRPVLFLCLFCSVEREFILNDKTLRQCKIDAQALKMVASGLPVYHVQRVECLCFIQPSLQELAGLFEDELLHAPWRIEPVALRAFYRLQSLFAVNNFRSMALVTLLQLRFYASHHIHLFPDVRKCGGRMKKNDF